MWKLISAYFITSFATLSGTPPSEISWHIFFFRNNRVRKAGDGSDLPDRGLSFNARKIAAGIVISCGIAASLYALFYGYRYWTLTVTIDDIWQQQNIAEQVLNQREQSGDLPTADEIFDTPSYLTRYGIGPARQYENAAGYFNITGRNWNSWGFSTKVAAALWLAPPKTKPNAFRIWNEVNIVDEYYDRNPPTANLVAVIAGAESASAESK